MPPALLHLSYVRLAITQLYFIYFEFYVTHETAMDIAIDTVSYLIPDIDTDIETTN